MRQVMGPEPAAGKRLGTAAGHSPRPRSPVPGQPACLGGLSLANDQHLFLLIRSAWRCRRLCAPPGGHGHPLGRGPPRLGHVAVPPREPPSFVHLHRGGGDTANNPPPSSLSSFQNLRLPHCAHDALEQAPQEPVLLC